MRLYKDEDYPTLKKWLGDRNLGDIPKDYLPEVGLIVPGLAVGFLLTTDTPLAFLEYFVSNPLANQDDRQEAIYQIAKELIEYAKHIGVEIVQMNSTAKTIIDQAVNLGFKDTHSKVLIKQI